MESFIDIVLILVGVAIAWTLLKALFKLTARLFSIGCVVLLGLVVLGWLLGWIG
jgi:hypothetical protein